MLVLKIFWLFLITMQLGGLTRCQDLENDYYYSSEQTDEADARSLSDNNGNVTYVSSKNLSGNIEMSTLKVLSTPVLEELEKQTGEGNTIVQNNGSLFEDASSVNGSPINKHDEFQSTTPFSSEGNSLQLEITAVTKNLTDVLKSEAMINGSTSGNFEGINEILGEPIATPTEQLGQFNNLSNYANSPDEHSNGSAVDGKDNEEVVASTKKNKLSDVSKKELEEIDSEVASNSEKELEDLTHFLKLDDDFLRTVTEDFESVTTTESQDSVIEDISSILSLDNDENSSFKKEFSRPINRLPIENSVNADIKDTTNLFNTILDVDKSASSFQEFEIEKTSKEAAESHEEQGTSFVVPTKNEEESIPEPLNAIKEKISFVVSTKTKEEISVPSNEVKEEISSVVSTEAKEDIISMGINDVKEKNSSVVSIKEEDEISVPVNQIEEAVKSAVRFEEKENDVASIKKVNEEIISTMPVNKVLEESTTEKLEKPTFIEDNLFSDKSASANNEKTETNETSIDRESTSVTTKEEFSTEATDDASISGIMFTTIESSSNEEQGLSVISSNETVPGKNSFSDNLNEMSKMLSTETASVTSSSMQMVNNPTSGTPEISFTTLNDKFVTTTSPAIQDTVTIVYKSLSENSDDFEDMGTTTFVPKPLNTAKTVTSDTSAIPTVETISYAFEKSFGSTFLPLSTTESLDETQFESTTSPAVGISESISEEMTTIEAETVASTLGNYNTDYTVVEVEDNEEIVTSTSLPLSISRSNDKRKKKEENKVPVTPDSMISELQAILANEDYADSDVPFRENDEIIDGLDALFPRVKTDKVSSTSLPFSTENALDFFTTTLLPMKVNTVLGAEEFSGFSTMTSTNEDVMITSTQKLIVPTVEYTTTPTLLNEVVFVTPKSVLNEVLADKNYSNNDTSMPLPIDVENVSSAEDFNGFSTVTNTNKDVETSTWAYILPIGATSSTQINEIHNVEETETVSFEPVTEPEDITTIIPEVSTQFENVILQTESTNPLESISFIHLQVLNEINDISSGQSGDKDEITDTSLFSGEATSLSTTENTATKIESTTEKVFIGMSNPEYSSNITERIKLEESKGVMLEAFLKLLTGLNDGFQKAVKQQLHLDRIEPISNNTDIKNNKSIACSRPLKSSKAEEIITTDVPATDEPTTSKTDEVIVELADNSAIGDDLSAVALDAVSINVSLDEKTSEEMDEEKEIDEKSTKETVSSSDSIKFYQTTPAIAETSQNDLNPNKLPRNFVNETKEVSSETFTNALNSFKEIERNQLSDEDLSFVDVDFPDDSSETQDFATNSDIDSILEVNDFEETDDSDAISAVNRIYDPAEETILRQVNHNRHSVDEAKDRDIMANEQDDEAAGDSNEFSFDDKPAPLVSGNVFDSTASFSIKIVESESHFYSYVPSDAYVRVDLESNTLNITWRSPTSDLNNSICFNITQNSENYVISGVQLNIVKDNDVLVLKKNVVVLPPQQHDKLESDKSKAITFNDNVRIFISNVDFLRGPDFRQRKLNPDTLSSHERIFPKDSTMLIVLGCVGLFIVISIAIAIIVGRNGKKTNADEIPV